MKPIEGQTNEAIGLELEGWTRRTAGEARFEGACVIVARASADGGAFFSYAADTPEAQMRLGAVLQHLGQQLVAHALRKRVDAGEAQGA